MEGGAEIGAVDGGVAGRFRVIKIFAFATVQLYGLNIRKVGEAGGEERVGEAGNARAFAEVRFFVFFELENVRLDCS